MLEESQGGVSTMLVENSLESPLPVDKLHSGNRLGRSRKPQEQLSVVKGYKRGAPANRGAVRGESCGENGETSGLAGLDLTAR